MITAMIDFLFTFFYRVHRGRLVRQINGREWDQDLSQAIDCLTYLIETLQQRKG